MGGGRNGLGSWLYGDSYKEGIMNVLDPKGIFAKPDVPDLPAPEKAPAPADPTDEQIKNAKLMERRRQLGLSSPEQTWLTGARGDTTSPDVAYNTVLGS